MGDTFKKIWFGESHSLGAAAFLIAASSVLSRLVGVIRDHLLATHFGAGAQLDAYYAAFRLPDTLYNLLIVGALSSGFIPVFAEYFERRGKEEAMKLAARVLSLAGWTLAAASILFIIFADVLVPHLTRGFSPEEVALTIRLSRIMGLSPLILGLSAVLGGILQATKRFFTFAIAPILYNVGIIIGILLFAPSLGIAGVAWGVIIGAALHLIVQASAIRSLNLRGLLKPSLKDEGIRRIIHLMLPRIAGLAITQINLIVLVAFASSLEAGSVSVFNLASNIQSFPFGVIGVSFAIAVFPALTHAFAIKSATSFNLALERITEKTLFYALPATILLILLRGDIVRILFQNGNFNAADAARTADVLFWFALSLVAQCLIPIFTRVFYARQNTRLPLLIGAIAEGTAILLAWILKGPYGVAGLAMAFSFSSFLYAALLILGSRIHYPLQLGPVWRSSVIRIFLSSTIFTLWTYLLFHGFSSLYRDQTLSHAIIRLTTTLFVGGLTYILISWHLRVPDAIHLHTTAHRAVGKSKENEIK
jgi:putative peptidoglycan lipid II flippase